MIHCAENPLPLQQHTTVVMDTLTSLLQQARLNGLS